ncbi:hypothetical protein [Parasitella parasitica]|uniref:Uncharacterized protein n=1 Tax=Parasitella parasitica TaxID=35722 RepID=A0A0B7MR67_9FUNG|nr:hypothetical protein [Parasitella parasitica]
MYTHVEINVFDLGIFPCLSRLDNETIVEHLNNVREVNFYHFIEDDTVTDLRVHITREEMIDARSELNQYLQRIQPRLAVFSSERLVKKHFKYNYAVQGTFKVIEWRNTGRHTACFVLPSTRRQIRIDLTRNFAMLGEAIEENGLDLQLEEI